MREEPSEDRRLHFGMFALAQVPLFKLAVDEVAVWMKAVADVVVFRRQFRLCRSRHRRSPLIET